ncbi:hypothetical protein GTA08_BOTSDO12902 [Botryosphaeria dothidea]|uniref:Uncharacterized protein n=1 Tax=Botryosphaeria dothidea TaxID=55169 RepID=A0A8H4J4D8_9PEZI|nr:hypothetical protein GTA08_BOTSDO12902 [Botryosphaeria dothidea]
MAFVEAMLNPRAVCHIRALLTADQTKLKAPHILNFESWNMLYFDTVSVGHWDNAFLAPRDMFDAFYAEVVRELRVGLFPDPFPWSARGLNRILSVDQQCRGLRELKENRVCANPGCNSTMSQKWFIKDGEAFQNYLCKRCFEYQRDHPGQNRPAALQQLYEKKKAV